MFHSVEVLHFWLAQWNATKKTSFTKVSNVRSVLILSETEANKYAASDFEQTSRSSVDCQLFGNKMYIHWITEKTDLLQMQLKSADTIADSSFCYGSRME